MQHRGEIVENVVRKSGISISVLATKMNISRNTLYNRFRERNLSYDFILTLGSIIHYDFGVNFPEMQRNGPAPEDPRAELWKLDKQYKILLEKYQRLLKFLLKKSQDVDQHTLYKRIQEFINSPDF